MADIIVCYIDYRPRDKAGKGEGEWRTLMNDFTGKPSVHPCEEQRRLMILVKGVKPLYEYRLREELVEE